jgi:hypothetical protein
VLLRPVCALLLVGGLASCSSFHAANAPNADSGAPDAGSTLGDGGAVTSVKPPLGGLIDMQSIVWHDTEGGEPVFTIANVTMFPAVFGGIVINATWDAIEPTADGPLDFGTIDSALAQIRTYNAANAAAPLGVKLRVYQGSNAPMWAKQINGGPVNIVRNPQGCVPPRVCPLTVASSGRRSTSRRGASSRASLPRSTTVSRSSSTSR